MQAAALLETLERLLTAPFPAPVPLPAGGLLLMLTRILSMDDVVHSSGAETAPLAPEDVAFCPLAISLMFGHPCMMTLLQACKTTRCLLQLMPRPRTELCRALSVPHWTCRRPSAQKVFGLESRDRPRTW